VRPGGPGHTGNAGGVEPGCAQRADLLHLQYISSSSGSDTYDGLSTGTPFATVSKVNTLNLQPGDRVLFKCGDTWRADPLILTRSGTQIAPIEFSSYPQGCADKPVLSGSRPVSGGFEQRGVDQLFDFVPDGPIICW
jgi:hypothetical protein